MWEKSKKELTPPDLILELANKLNPSYDVTQVPLQIEKKKAYLLYIKTVVDGMTLQEVLIKPFYEMATQSHFEAYTNSLPNKAEPKNREELLLNITRGHVLVAINNQFVLLDLRKVSNDEVQDTIMEPTIHGPQLGFSEDLETNINLIRHRYNKSSLKFESLNLPDTSKKSAVIFYDEETVNQKILNSIKKKLNTLDMPLIQSTGDLKLFFNEKKYSLFPTMMLTERPDRITYNLTSGKIVLMVEGSPEAILAPVVFFDFMISIEDNYHNKWISIFTMTLRYIGLIICVILPALYVAVTSYNPEIFRIELALTVAGGRIGVPYSSFIEVMFMLIFMELLTEASIRLPKAVSATATTVGGLILGTAATEAALASNIMIIIVSAVAISTFVIPINEMSFSMRISRFLLLIFTWFFGFPGVIFGFLGLVMYMTNITSFGEPYLRITWQSKRKEIKVNK